jgi:DNA invertase Pin-like site-specific DNA recombinase
MSGHSSATVRSAGIYCRISEDRLGSGLGVERQQKDCEAMAAKRGWRVSAVYVDNDVSAYSGKPRVEYRRLLRDIEAGEIDAVVVWHLDRLHRQPKELEAFIDLVERKGVALASVSGEHDLATPEGRLHARILGAVARMESEHKSRRIRRKKLEMAQAGRPLGGGNRPFGYADDQVTVIPDEASAIREVAERLLAGQSIRSVCIDLNARGITTAQGRRWIPLTLKRTILRPRNAGIIEHREGGLFDATWPAIITKDQLARLTALLKDPRRNRGPGPPRRYLLSGILRCGECGARMVAGPASRGHTRVYWCMPKPKGCGRISIVAEWLEEFVSEMVLAALDNPKIHTQTPSATGDDRADLDAIGLDRSLLEELAVAYADRKISMAEWLAARAPIEERIGTATQRIADRVEDQSLRGLVRAGTRLRDVWRELDVEKQRAVIETVLDHIVVKRVGKGSYRDTSRLIPAWRR